MKICFLVIYKNVLLPFTSSYWSLPPHLFLTAPLLVPDSLPLSPLALRPCYPILCPLPVKMECRNVRRVGKGRTWIGSVSLCSQPKLWCSNQVCVSRCTHVCAKLVMTWLSFRFNLLIFCCDASRFLWKMKSLLAWPSVVLVFSSINNVMYTSTAHFNIGIIVINDQKKNSCYYETPALNVITPFSGSHQLLLYIPAGSISHHHWRSGACKVFYDMILLYF